MIWALLALLGIPIWFIAIVLIAVFQNRSRVKKAEGVPGKAQSAVHGERPNAVSAQTV